MEDAKGRATACSFEDILADFKRNAQLTSKEHEVFGNDDLDKLRSTIHRIQKEQEAKKRMRHMKRLEPFLRTMEQYGKVVEIFVNTSEVLAFVWGPMKWLLIVASNYSEALDSLLDAYQIIWEELPLLSSFQRLFQERPYLQTVLSWIYQDIMDFHREAMLYFRQKTWKQVFQAAWRGFKLKIDWIKHRMQRHGNLIRTEASLAEFEAIRRLNQTAITEFNNMKQAELDRRRNVTIQWLSAPSSQIVQEDCVEARASCAGAGDWLVANDQFKNWFDPQYCSNPLLWMTGKPGAGKSVLVSRVVEELQRLSSAPTTTHDICAAYFYCKHLDPTRNSFIAVARGVLSQLLRQQSHLLQHMYEQLSLSGDITLSSKTMAQDLLNIALNGCKITYIVIDGFDECDRKSRKDIISFFRGAVESLPSVEMDTIRCLFVGQDDGIARKDLGGVPTISITPADNKCDIRRFAQAWHTKIQSKLGLEGARYDLVKVVTARSQGMFLFAKLVMENLFEQTTQDKLMAELEQFPSGLDEAYGRIVDRVLNTRTDSRRADSLRLLEWLVCAKRPLKWYELQGALCIDLQDETGREVDFQARKYHESPKDLCASLVEFRKDQTVEFVHPTAKEYLIRRSLIARSTSEHMIASLTLGYLGLPIMAQDASRETITDALMIGSFAYLEYAVACWSFHLQAALDFHPEKDKLATLSEDVAVFLENRYRDSPSNNHISKAVRSHLSSLNSYDCFEELCQAVSWSQKQIGIHGQPPSGDDILDLSDIIAGVRDVLENVSTSSIGNDKINDLRTMYGPNWFKCPRMNCFYFHQGFRSINQRQQHLNRHEKPFMCIVPGCDASTFGFSSQELLNSHMNEEHGISTASELEFPEPKKNTSRHAAAQGLHACNLCPKTFTRAHNLRAHLRSHANEKPFLCVVCEKGFARKHDLKRHESSTHSEEKKYVCSGTLKSGDSWGCNATFSRQDKLAEHFKSKMGQKCVKLFLAEERVECPEVGQERDICQILGIDLSLFAKPAFRPDTSYLRTTVLETLEPKWSPQVSSPWR